MRQGEAFLERTESVQKHWQAIKDTVHPGLLEMAKLFKECVEMTKPLYKYGSRELLAPVEARFEKGCEEILRRFSGPVQPPKNYFPCEIIFPLEAAHQHEGVALAAFLHWERHKIPLTVDVERMKKGDGKASRRFQRTFADFEAIRCEKKKPNPFKGKMDHSNMFQFGLKLGLENLTAEELAIFFDRFCPTCEDAHNANALRRQRTEFVKALQRALEPASTR